MQRLKLLVFPFGALLLLSGCIVRSMHPLYTDENVLFDTRLIGQWTEEDSKQDEQRYKCVVYEDEGEQSILEAHLLEIRRFLPTSYPARAFICICQAN